MSEIDRIRAAAAHPENWKSVKVSPHPSERAACVLLSLMTSWPSLRPRRRTIPNLHARRVKR